ncbi:MAG: NAD-dependent succinate-semialdehyde dehydrogenase, partial [Gammaproteobacteria bacterium]|nr:NAD-dependent succinate-semialdehyde dehydrogenase [Gammaproteobacteria bacterium]
MNIYSINPANGQRIKSYRLHTNEEVQSILALSVNAQQEWKSTSFTSRADCLYQLASHLRDNHLLLASLITSEMGKLLTEAKAEIEKCAWACEYYAEHGANCLQDEIIETDASNSRIVYQPLGTILAVMPWNFPFWQVIRCAVPAIMAGNSILLKHASNVPGCGLALQQLFLDSGFPENLFSTLLISADQVEAVIADDRVHGVSLTGSEQAGRAVAASAGKYLKKSLLELGGSDAFVVLADADLDTAVSAGMTSRFLNAGQSCIAAKRFVVVESIADQFVDKLLVAINKLQPGDPLDESTTLAPMARDDLCLELHRQVIGSVDMGVVKLTGGERVSRSGWYYKPTLLDHVKPGMPVYEQETFGPVAVVVRVRDEQQALQVANDSRFGLGASVWTKNSELAEWFVENIQAGCLFVNGMVKSDPRLPFG